MKTNIFKIFFIIFLLFLFTGCGSQNANTPIKYHKGKSTKLHHAVNDLFFSQSNTFDSSIKRRAKVKKLIESGADVNAYDSRGKTPYLILIKKKQTHLAKLALKHGANINIHDNEGNTPLSYVLEGSSWNFKFDDIKYFIDNSNDYILNLPNKNGDTPLHITAYKNKSKIVKLLVDAGAKVNLKNKNNATPYSMALSKGYDGIADYLLKHGAKLDYSVDKYGNNLCHEAAKSGNLGLLKKLIDNSIPMDVPNKYGVTPLTYAVSQGHINIYNYLLNKGAKVTRIDTAGNNLLHKAAMSGSVEIAKLLLSNGLNINSKNNSGATPLMIAVSNNKNIFIDFALTNGAKLSLDNKGNTLLHKASSNSNIEAIKKFMFDININTKNNEGNTPFLLSSKIEVMKLLIANGANMNAKNKKLENILMIAYNNHKDDMFKYLLENYKVDINSKNIKGKTILMKSLNSSAWYGVKDARILIQAGANINLKDNQGNTALHSIIEHRNYDVAKYFVTQGGDLSIKNKKGQTPLDLIKDNKIKTELQGSQIDYFIANNKLNELKDFTDKNPNTVYFIKDQKLRLALTGPKGMKVGDIRKMLKNGRSPSLVSSLIKRVNAPYKEYTLNEIDTLGQMGINDQVIATMIDVTTAILKDKKRKAEQEFYLAEQKKIASQKVKVIYRDNPNQVRSEQKVDKNGNPLLDKLQDKLIEKAAEKLFDKLF